MEITGKIIAVMPERSGVSAKGTQWKSQEFVIETFESYPKKCVFQVFGEERLSSFAINLNEVITVSFNVDAHEYNGRWFNSLTAYNVTRTDAASQAQSFNTGTIPTSPSNSQSLPTTANSVTMDENEDDLPF